MSNKKTVFGVPIFCVSECSVHHNGMRHEQNEWIKRFCDGCKEEGRIVNEMNIHILR